MNDIKIERRGFCMCNIEGFFLSKNRNFLWNLANYLPNKLTLRFPSQFEWRFCMSWPLTSPTVHNVDRLVLTQNFEGMLTLPGCLSPFYLAVRKHLLVSLIFTLACFFLPIEFLDFQRLAVWGKDTLKMIAKKKKKFLPQFFTCHQIALLNA